MTYTATQSRKPDRDRNWRLCKGKEVIADFLHHGKECKACAKALNELKGLKKVLEVRP